jgi:hypothetical protein
MTHLLFGECSMAQEPSQKNEICSYAFFLNHARIEAEYDDLYPPMSSIIRYGVPGDYHYENIEPPSSDSQFLCLSDENEEYYSTWRNHTLAPSADSLNPLVAWSRSSNSQINGFDPKLYSNQIYWILQKEEEKSLSANSHRSSQDSEWSDNMIAITIFSTLIVGAYATRSSWSNTHQSEIITVNHDDHEYRSPSARRYPTVSSTQQELGNVRRSFPSTYTGQSDSEHENSEHDDQLSQGHHEFPTSTQSTNNSDVSVITYYDCQSFSARSPSLTDHKTNTRSSFVQYDEDPLNNNPTLGNNPHLEEKSEVFRGIYHPCPWEQRTDQHFQSSSEEDSSSVSDQEDEEVIKYDPNTDEYFPVGMSPGVDDPHNKE